MPDRARVLGCYIDRLSMSDTIRRCEEVILNGHRAQHVSINAAKLMSIRKDSVQREAVARCSLVSADGQSIVWASKLLGDPLPERVAGIDLMHRLLSLAEEKGYRPYFLGATQEVLERAVERLNELYPRLQLAGVHHGYFDDAESMTVCDAIRGTRPHMLFVAMSSPRKEIWVARHSDDLCVPFTMGVGGSIDVLAGVTRRAPRWMQRIGMEWFFRLIQEPRRLGRRYLTTNLLFLALLCRELVTRRLVVRH